ncbi:bifunctional monodehydroascorbate reductase and carbonic anhydrase nectarin-3 [Hibiscus syriacus]|uniref:Bifunctional monodehydroascorbate reductase and carbonic anhydrase nectarin-3 n=1 Tax=Hibiscus syriacus TaxID=106335 RepID=A0A6A2WSJ8_HIBSY|nr:bifunctional monodehydroascorbate reductase and carbonic anhydrase nectarin-3 [Hibiscus syriacus]
MSKKGGASLQKDVPWRVSAGKSIPRILHSFVLRLRQTPNSSYVIAVMKYSDPIESGLATEAIVEAAGPECIVPGQIAPIR